MTTDDKIGWNGGDEDLKKLFHSLENSKAKRQENSSGWTLCNKKQKSVAVCLMSGFFAGLVPATSRYVQDRGYTPFQMIFFNDLFITLVSVVVILYYKTFYLPSCRQGAHLLAQGFSRLFIQGSMVTAYHHVPPANAENVYSASFPVFVVLVVAACLRQVPSPVVIWGSVWNIAGVVLLGCGNFDHEAFSQNTKGAALGFSLALAAALVNAIANVGLPSLLRDVPKRVVLACIHGVSTVFASIFAGIFSSTWELDSTTAGVLIANTVSHASFIVLMYVSLEFLDVTTETVLLQVSALSAYALQWAILGFVPTRLEVIGLVCIIVGTSSVVISGVIARWKEEKHNLFITQMGFNYEAHKSCE